MLKYGTLIFSCVIVWRNPHKTMMF